MQNKERIQDSAFRFGSRTARAGFQNEKDLANAINDWGNDDEGRWILDSIGIDLDSIVEVNAKTISGHKSDVVVQVIGKESKTNTVGFQVKLVSNRRGFNQIDKRWVDQYQKLWDISAPITNILKLYTGEVSHAVAGSRDARRLFADELPATESKRVLDFLADKKEIISNTVFRGDSDHPADWMIVVQNYDLVRRLFVFDIKTVIDFYFNDVPTITPRGNFKFGKVTIQRKGGDRGRDTAKMLQFKIDPISIVEATNV